MNDELKKALWDKKLIYSKKPGRLQKLWWKLTFQRTEKTVGIDCCSDTGTCIAKAKKYPNGHVEITNFQWSGFSIPVEGEQK